MDQSITFKYSTPLTRCQYFLPEIYMKINKTTPDDNNYLQGLCYIDNKPRALYYIGTLPTERQLTLAIVGKRKPTRYGTEVALRFAGELARRETIIVSGLALGIDALAHRACLEADGTTIAIFSQPTARHSPRRQPRARQKNHRAGRRHHVRALHERARTVHRRQM